MAAEEGSVRDMEDFLAGTGVFGGERVETEDPEIEEEVVHDERPGHEPDEQRSAPPSPEPEAVEDETEEEETEEEGEPHVVWATKKYGADHNRWAKAAFDQERFISSLLEEKRSAEEAASQAIEYARSVEANAQSGPAGMPMTAAQEAWVDQALSNPVGYAYQAAMAGDMQLYNAVIERVAEVDAGMAANVGTQVQLTMHAERQRMESEASARSNGSGAGTDFNTDLGQSFDRLGINVQTYGEAMWKKFEELGEYHPYTLAALGGDAIQRDLAVSAVYDLVRTGQTSTRRIADDEREAQIQREGELRRNAAGVVTGSPHVEPVRETPLMEGMLAEWKRRGQWSEEE